MVITHPAIAANASEYYEAALTRYLNEEYTASTILLKNALTIDPNHLTSRILLGKNFLHEGYAVLAEKEFRRALELGGDNEEISAPLANSYFLQGRFKQLLDEINGLGLSNDAKIQILVIRGYAHIQIGELEPAISSFNKARSLAPYDVRPILGLAIVAIHQGKLEQAADLVSVAEQYNPDDAGIFFAKGEIQRLRGDQNEALDYLNDALMRDPQHIQARKSRAAVLTTLGKDNLAREDVDFIRQRSPNDLYALYLHAILLSRSGEYNEAMSEIQTITNSLSTLNADFINNHAPTLLLLGMLEYLQNHLEKAANYLERYLKIQHHHIHPRLVLAELRIKQGDNGGAIPLLRPIISEYSEHADALALLGTALFNENRFFEATEILEKAVRLNPDNASLRTKLAMSRQGEGDVSGAMDELGAVMEMDAATPHPGIMLAKIQLREAKYSDALRTTEKLRQRYPSNSTVMNLYAAANMGIGDITTARNVFESVVELDSDFALARLNLASIEIREGKYDAARGHYEAILRHTPQDVRALSGLANIADLENKPNEAISWLEKILALNTQADISVELLRLTRFYLETNQPDAALETAKMLERLKPSDLAVMEVMGLSYLALNNTNTAAKYFRIIYQSNPQSPAVLNRVSVLLLRTQDFEAAEKAVHSALQIDPGYLPARKTEVALLVMRGQTELAKTLAIKLQNDHPELAMGYKLLGDILLQSGDFGEAGEAYKSAFDREPTTEFLLDQVQVLRVGGHIDKALELMENWLQSNPADHRVRNLIASIRYQTGQIEAARSHYEMLAQLRPDDASVLNSLAVVYQKTGDARAVDYARKAYSLQSFDPSIDDTLGWILVNEGKVNEGLEHLRQARARAFINPEVRYHLAVALHKLGRDEEAERELKVALASASPFNEKSAAELLLAEIQKTEK